MQRGELAELQLQVREPGGSVGICRNGALGLPLAAESFYDVLREVAQAYREGTFP